MRVPLRRRRAVPRRSIEQLTAVIWVWSDCCCATEPTRRSATTTGRLRYTRYRTGARCETWSGLSAVNCLLMCDVRTGCRARSSGGVSAPPTELPDAPQPPEQEAAAAPSDGSITGGSAGAPKTTEVTHRAKTVRRTFRTDFKKGSVSPWFEKLLRQETDQVSGPKRKQ